MPDTMTQSLVFSPGPLLVDNNLDRSTFDTGSNTAHKAQFKTPEPAPPTTPESSQSPASGASASTPTGGQTNAEENKGTAGKKGRRFGGYGMGPVTREVAGYMQRNGSKLCVQNQLIVARLALGIIQLLSFLASQFCVLRGVLTTQLLPLQLLKCAICAFPDRSDTCKIDSFTACHNDILICVCA